MQILLVDSLHEILYKFNVNRLFCIFLIVDVIFPVIPRACHLGAQFFINLNLSPELRSRVSFPKNINSNFTYVGIDAIE